MANGGERAGEGRAKARRAPAPGGCGAPGSGMMTSLRPHRPACGGTSARILQKWNP
ncbi:hypothetical protein GCM10023082_57180 [Streptomyces tremellae]|uniref:Uncharacterized protein n=1 Tax=Streptomyces tremellae TaxID=1124239 RepID=A0ABP7G210_9ACTN